MAVFDFHQVRAGGRGRRGLLAVMLLAMLFACAVTAGEGNESIFLAVEPHDFTVRREFSVDKEKDRNVRLLIPVPVDGPGQKILAVRHTAGEIMPVPGHPGQKMVSVVIADASSGPVEVFVEYDIRKWAYRARLDQIGELEPYDTDSDAYKAYTAPEPPVIDPGNADIAKVAETLWKDSANALDYARRAFLFVKKEVRHNNAYQQQPAADTLRNGGKNGNLQALYVSLLRARGIPARVVHEIRADGGSGYYSEFLLEGHGWIPANPERVFNDWQKDDTFFGMVHFPENYATFFETVYGVAVGTAFAAVPVPAAEGENPLSFRADYSATVMGVRNFPKNKTRVVINDAAKAP